MILSSHRLISYSDTFRQWRVQSGDESDGMEIRLDVLSIATEWFERFERRLMPGLITKLEDEAAIAARVGGRQNGSEPGPREGTNLPAAIARIMSEVKAVQVHRLTMRWACITVPSFALIVLSRVVCVVLPSRGTRVDLCPRLVLPKVGVCSIRQVLRSSHVTYVRRCSLYHPS